MQLCLTVYSVLFVTSWEMFLLCLLLLTGVPATNTQALDNTMIPFPSNISVSFRTNTTIIDVRWISNTTSPVIPTNDMSLNRFFINITYLGPCENYTQFSSRDFVQGRPPGLSGEEFMASVSNLQEYSNYSVSVEGVTLNASTVGRSPPVSVMFQTKVGAPSTIRRVKATVLNSTAVSVKWDALSCIDRNGILSSYRISIVNRDAYINIMVPSFGLSVPISEQMQSPLSVTFTELAPSSNYRVSVKAENTVGLLSASRPVKFLFSTEGVTYMGFLLKGRRYVENSLVSVEDISEFDGALLCVTPRRECCAGTFTNSMGAIGEWYYPNDTRVLIRSENGTVYRNRWNGTVRLNKRLEGTIDIQGIFTCEIPDSQGFMRNITIGIYPRDGGNLVSLGDLRYERINSTVSQFTYTTTGGPATHVVWEKDNLVLTNCLLVKTWSTIVSKTEATYLHTLNILTDDNATGFYRVTVGNSKSNVTASIHTSSVPIQLLLGGVADCDSLIKALSPRSLFTVVWSRVQQSCSGVNASIVNASLMFCNPDSGGNVTLRGVLVTSRPATLTVSALSCIEQWIHSGSNITVDGLTLYPLGGCPVQISSLDQPPCTDISGGTGSDGVPTRPTSSTCPSDTILPLVIVVAGICFIVSITVNIVLVLYAVTLKRRMKKLSTDTPHKGFKNHLTDANELRSRTNSKSVATSAVSLESENTYHVPPDALPRVSSPSPEPEPGQIVRSSSVKESRKPADFLMMKSQSSHTLPHTEIGAMEHMKTFEAATKPKTAKKPERKKKSQPMNAENVQNVDEGEYASLIEATRQKMHSYERTIVSSAPAHDSVIYVEPESLEEVYDDIACGTKNKERVYYNEPSNAGISK